MKERPRASLPAEMTTFAGRRAEIAAVGDLVAAHRLVTLIGPGGVGKTRLASQAGASLVERFSGGAWFTDLSLTSQPELVPALVAEPFDVGDVGTARPRPLTNVLASPDLPAATPSQSSASSRWRWPSCTAERLTTRRPACMPTIKVVPPQRTAAEDVFFAVRVGWDQVGGGSIERDEASIRGDLGIIARVVSLAADEVRAAGVEGDVAAGRGDRVPPRECGA